MPIVGTNVKVEVQKTLGSALPLTALTNANPAVATSAAHGLANGDVVVLDVSGMGELDGQAVRVANVTANTFELEGIDSTSFGTFTSGSAQKVTAWDTFSLATSLSSDAQTADELDATTLLDTQKKVIYGLLSAAKGSFGALWEATDVALVNLRRATKTKAARAFRVTFANSNKLIFNALVAMGDMPQLEAAGLGKATCSWTLQGYMAVPYTT